MKLLFVNQFYWPDLAATAQRLTDLAEYLAQHGHQVHVLCSRGPYDRGTGRPDASHEIRNGVTIHRAWGLSAGKRGMLRRVCDYLMFHLFCGGWLLTRGLRYDALVTLTSPPLIGIYGTGLKALSFGRVRHVCWSMDLHPDAEFELGMWSRRNPLWRSLDALNGLHFRAADAVVALGDRMKQRLCAKGVKPHRLHVIPMWHRREHAPAIDSRGSTLRARYGLEDRFIILYAGNAGLVHTFQGVCDAMDALKDSPRFHFVFAGGGKRMEEVFQFVKHHGLSNCTRLQYFGQEDLHDLLALGDVHLITLRQGMSGVAVPCKLYGIMAAAKPVIYIGPLDSDTADHIRQAGAGILLSLFEDSSLPAHLRALEADPTLGAKYGAAARNSFLLKYERMVCCGQWQAMIEGLEDPSRSDRHNHAIVGHLHRDPDVQQIDR